MSHDVRISLCIDEKIHGIRGDLLKSEPSARVSTNRSLGMRVNPAVQSSYVKDDVEATSLGHGAHFRWRPHPEPKNEIMQMIRKNSMR